jgi:hypothetical protein
LSVQFVVSRAPDPDVDAATAADASSSLDARLDQEAAEHGDIFFASTPEGYGRLWTKALEFLEARLGSEKDGGASGPPPPPPPMPPSPDFFFHADDDSYVRLDRVVRGVLGRSAPRRRFYWGYVWNGGGGGGAAAECRDGGNGGVNGSGSGRTTAPIRDPRNKSFMPLEHYPLPDYPPFCSGCGFALSRDLAEALVDGARRGAVPRTYRVLDPPFGIHLCGPAPPKGRGVFGGGGGGAEWEEEEEKGAEEEEKEGDARAGPVVPVHDDRVRPYRALPLFDGHTIVQHYLRPEEMAGFHAQVLESALGRGDGGGGDGSGGKGSGGDNGGAAAQLYEQLVGMGLLRR